MWWNKKTIVTVNVKKLHINLLTTRDIPYYIEVSGYWVKKNIFKTAHTAMWEKLITNQYIKIDETKYLNTNDIVEVKIQATEELIITKEICGKKYLLL